jgi:hypothetical protein
MRYYPSLFLTGAFLILLQGAVWAEPIQLSITPTVSSLEASGEAAPGDANPQNKKISFQLNLEKEAKVEVDIYNSDGKRVAVIKQVMAAGPGTVVWNCGSVPPGNFQARLKLDGKQMKTKISLVK